MTTHRPRSNWFLVLSVVIAMPVCSPSAAKYAGDPFSLGVGARSLALGGATIAGPFDGTSIWWNPAGMVSLDGRHISAMHAETFGSLLNHDFVSYVDSRDRIGIVKAFGFYFYYLGGGGIRITALDQYNRPYVVREESHGDYVMAASLGIALSERWNAGVSAKILYRDLGTETGKGLTLDAGVLYNPRENFAAGLMVTDISSGFIRYSGKTFGGGAHTESIYPTLKPAISFRKQHKDLSGQFSASGDLKFENLRGAAQYWSGAVSLDSHYGLELGWREMLFARAGFDIGRMTAGGGFIYRHVAIDFAWMHQSTFDETFRVSASYKL
jgi:hypothetical protein